MPKKLPKILKMIWNVLTIASVTKMTMAKKKMPKEGRTSLKNRKVKPPRSTRILRNLKDDDVKRIEDAKLRKQVEGFIQKQKTRNEVGQGQSFEKWKSRKDKYTFSSNL